MKRLVISVLIVCLLFLSACNSNDYDDQKSETVFSSIIWDEDRFGTQESAERKYFQEYLERVKSSGREVYLLEYTMDEKVIKDIKDYCSEKGYKYYISSTLGLEVEK